MGLGLAWITKDKAEEVVSELVRQGQVSLEQSREAVNQLLEEAEEQRGELTRFVNAQIERGIEAAGLARREDIRQLEERVARLERLLASGQSPDGDG